MKIRTVFYAILLFVAAACHKEPNPPTACDTDGVVKSSHELKVTCDGLYIVATDGTVFQPVMSEELFTGVQPGDRIRFGYKPVMLGMRDCGATTVKITCMERKRNSK